MHHVSTLAVEWIEISECGWIHRRLLSPPSRWSGLKSDKIMYNTSTEEVSTLAVEWIEIGCVLEKAICRRVSTLAVEWIEITEQNTDIVLLFVSTLAVEWIEIPQLVVFP